MRSFTGSKRIMGINEIHETENSIYIVMPYCNGGILNTDIRYPNIEYSDAEIFELFSALIETLAELKAKNYMHRDIKPANIMFQKKNDLNSLMLIDLGMIHYRKGKKSPEYTKCGTPGYMAPEVINYKKGTPLYSTKCDVFSLGLVFYELITGLQVFRGENV